MRNPLVLGLMLASLGVIWIDSLRAQETIYSGPQPGEALPTLNVRGVFDDDAGKSHEVVGESGEKPLLLVFVHGVNRPSIAFTRVLTQYALTRRPDGLQSYTIWLDDDASAAEMQLKRMRHALTAGAPLGISTDGREGPGSYGLNRNVTLTILMSKNKKVTANFALVQPSLQADLPKVLQSIVDVIGGPLPKIEELEGMPRMAATDNASTKPPEMRPLLLPLIDRQATDAMVDTAAQAIEAAAAKDPAVRKELLRIAKTIVDAGKLTNYGTARAQSHLARWAKEADSSTKSREKPTKESSDQPLKEPAKPNEEPNAKPAEPVKVRP